jgi:hypothetical protein
MMIFEQFTYPYVRRNLRRRYPEKLGWRIHVKDDYRKSAPDFVVERVTRKGIIERVIVRVKKATLLKRQHFDAINRYARIMTRGDMKIVNKIMVVPWGSRIDEAPADVTIMKLRSFRCNGDRIIHEL